MDAIEAMDWGAYAHFSFQGRDLSAELIRCATLYRSVSNAGGSYYLFVAAMIFFALSRRLRNVFVTFVSFIVAVALIYVVHHLVPRRRPPDAQRWIGVEQMVGSFPSGDVLLYTLGAILLGFALWRIAPRYWQRGLYVLVAALLVVAVCLVQLFLCLHWVTDLIGGIVGGVLIGLIAYRFFSVPAEPKIDTSTAIMADAGGFRA